MQSVEPVLENAIKTLQKVVDVRGMGKKWAAPYVSIWVYVLRPSLIFKNTSQNPNLVVALFRVNFIVFLRFERRGPAIAGKL
jgi:hypothetical protein